MPALTVVTRYFSVDADHDISADVLSLSSDRVTWTAGAYVASPSTHLLAATPAPSTGLTRYWWSLTVGPGQAVTPQAGTDVVYGRLVDGLQTLYYEWTIFTQF